MVQPQIAYRRLQACNKSTEMLPGGSATIMQSNRLMQAPHKGLCKLRCDICGEVQHHHPRLDLLSFWAAPSRQWQPSLLTRHCRC